MAGKFLDDDGLLYFWQKIKNKFAPIASPTFTGTPAAPTAVSGTNTTQIATTAFVQDAVGALDTGVTGVKGSAESSYRTGNVNITAANIGVAAGAEVNQNAFSNVKVGSTTVAADTKTDTLELVAGSNITLTPDATNDKVTIAATDTTYSDFTGATSSAAGTHGLVPAPTMDNNIRWLNSQGGWDNVEFVLFGAGGGTGESGVLLWNDDDLTCEVTALDGSLFDTQAANHVFAGPSSGSAATPDFRALVAADIPNLNTSKLTAGTLGVARGGTGASTLGAGVVYHSASGTGALSIATAANLVSAIGNSAVNRATGDADGNAIKTTYLKVADASSTYLTQSDANTTYAKKTDISGMYKYKGSVASESSLPASPSTGDVYNIEASSSYGGPGANVAWNGTAWDSLGEIFQITAITNAEIDTIVAA